MGWARFDDKYTDHPKIVQAGPWAELLDMRAIIYSARHETDGFLPKNVLRMIGNGIRKPAEQARTLVEVGRWREDPAGGWWVVDFLDYNPSKASKDKVRADARDRKTRNRPLEVEGSGQAPNGVQVRANSAKGSRTPSPTPTPLVTNHPLTGSSSGASPGCGEDDFLSTTASTRAAVFDLMAAARVQTTPSVRNPEAYRRAVRANLEAEHGTRLDELLADFPTAPPATLAGALMGEPNRLGDHRRRPQ